MKAPLVGDHFLYSPDLNDRFSCITVRRIYMLGHSAFKARVLQKKEPGPWRLFGYLISLKRIVFAEA